MPTPAERIAVRESRAADLFDLPVSEFRALVRQGVIPKPRQIGDHQRWLVRDLEAILDGRSQLSEDDFEP